MGISDNMQLTTHERLMSYIAPDLTEGLAEPPRLRSWEIDASFKCPVIGWCLDIAEQREILRKEGICVKDKSDFEAHEEIDSIREELYWLTFARLNELTLFCAGNYADNFEFTAAGDLLVNPRLTTVHVRGLSEPVVKNRHSRITERFRCAASTKKEVIQWLKNETFLEIKKEPLLAYLYERLKNSGYISQQYLYATDRRMRQIADVIVHLWSWHLPSGLDLHYRLQYSSQSEREFIKSRLCQFDREIFNDLGHDFHAIIQGEGCKIKFLR
jgi:hypothetical protein